MKDISRRAGHRGASGRGIVRLYLAGTAAALIAGCGGSTPSVVEPEVPLLTALNVTPSSAILYTTAPGNQVTLVASPNDQTGKAMTGLSAATFSSDNQSVASVSGNGLVTSVSAGTAHISVSLTAGSITKTTFVNIEVSPGAETASIFAPAFAFEPSVVHVSAGGTVTWTFTAITHTVDFSTSGAPAPIGALSQGSESRSFPVPGSYSFHCSIHPLMVGTVYVH